MIRHQAVIFAGELCAVLGVALGVAYKQIAGVPTLTLHMQPTAYVVAAGDTRMVAWSVTGALVVLAGGLVAALVISRAMDRLAGVGRYVDRLADPYRCPDCGQRYGANDDIFTPHYCAPRAER